MAHPPPFEASCAAFEYAFPVDRLLQRLKYGGALALAEWAAAGWLRTFSHRVGADLCAPEVIVPIPLAPSRQRERGYNQAQAIARCIASELRVVTAMHLVRVRDAPAQAALPWSARNTNVRDVFHASPAVAGKVCAIVDDVMTTGATVRDAARALREAGAARVVVWVVARTLPPEQAS